MEDAAGRPLAGIFNIVNELTRDTCENPVEKVLASGGIVGLANHTALIRKDGREIVIADSGAPIRKQCPLFPFVEETARFALSGSNVSLSCEVPAGLWPCEIDKNQIGQVIDNIVINGQQAMPQGGTISIAAANVTLDGPSALSLKPGPYVKISIRDWGIGIPPQILPRIFDPFFTTKQKGSGLGLATAYSIITRHEGRIDVESQPGSGSVFRLYLPASTAAAGEEEATREVPVSHKGRGRVLVLDDEQILRDTLACMLESLGYTAVCFADGADAVRHFTEETKRSAHFAAIVLDLTIPGGMGGVDAAAAIRKIDGSVPLFVASGYADDPVLTQPPRFGFTGSIVKPFIRAELAAMLERHVSNPQGG